MATTTNKLATMLRNALTRWRESDGQLSEAEVTEIEQGFAALAEYDAQQENPPFSPIVAADLAPPRVAITVNDGFISVYADKEVAVRVIDYDTDGSDPAQIRTVFFSDGDTRDGLVFDYADECGIDPEWIDQLFALEPSE